jgi:serine/threonine protein kinase
MTLEPGSQLGPYKVISLAGSGGMGEVYRARDTRLDRVVAVKILPPGVADDPVRLARFEREARTTAALAHPRICTLHDTGRDGQCWYFVTEYVEGETLKSRLLRGGLPLDKALRYAIEIAEALDYAHRRHVLHRDIKPANIMLTSTGVKLLDFGLAATESTPVFEIEQARSDTISLTAEGTFVGTVQYAAPEQLEGKPVDARTDLFAFGAVLYEMLTGRRAFPGDSVASVIAAILSSDPPQVTTVRPSVAPPLNRLVARLLAKDPEERWQTARDVLAELKWIQNERQIRNELRWDYIVHCLVARWAVPCLSGIGRRWPRALDSQYRVGQNLATRRHARRLGPVLVARQPLCWIRGGWKAEEGGSRRWSSRNNRQFRREPIWRILERGRHDRLPPCRRRTSVPCVDRWRSGRRGDAY